MVVTALSVVAAVGWLIAFWLWVHLRTWADQCKHSRIVIAYKRKVKIDAPLTEWLLWIRKAEKDKSATGRVIYSMGGTSVAIIRRGRSARPANQPREPRIGKYTATDQTDKQQQPSQLSQVTNGESK